MEHLLLKAATTAATDKGEFTAVISTATIDREKDIVDPAGFVRALHKWVPLGKNVPLAWNHSGRPEDQIGYIDPATVRVQGNEVVASGKFDLDTSNGAHAWRCVKAGTIGFSFGYLVPSGGSTKRAGGGRHIKELDVFEVTATPTPMNGDTRVLAFKALNGHDAGPHARDNLKYLIRYYLGKAHPFTNCVTDNTKRFGADGADRVCATLKDVGLGTTHWRNGGRGKSVADSIPPPDAAYTDDDVEEQMCQEILDAAGGNLDGLMAMLMEHMHANGDMPGGPGKALDPTQLRAEADKLSREFSLRGAIKRLPGAADAEDEDDPAELLGGMISTAQDFIDDEDDPNDVAVMRQVMELLLRLQSDEATEAPDDGKSLARISQLEGELADARAKLQDVDSFRRAGEALTLDAVKNTRRRGKSREPDTVAEWVIPEGELAGARSGELKAAWTTAYQNSLPNSSFLYVAPGGDKDSEGKSIPRTLRMFPYKDSSGAVDMPHLRNTLALIPQSDLAQDVKDKLTARAQNILDNQKALVVDPDVAVDVTDRRQEPVSVDPLVQQAKVLAAQWRGHGISRPKPPREEAPPRPELDPEQLRREMRDLMFTSLRH
jgi:HK97 family phage prohead protease